MAECSICLESILGVTKTIRCGHTFHKTCLSTWEKHENGHTCPMCRHVFKKPVVTLRDITNIENLIADLFHESFILSVLV
jgi:hypothetical protein